MNDMKQSTKKINRFNIYSKKVTRGVIYIPRDLLRFKPRRDHRRVKTNVCIGRVRLESFELSVLASTRTRTAGARFSRRLFFQFTPRIDRISFELIGQSRFSVLRKQTRTPLRWERK